MSSTRGLRPAKSPELRHSLDAPAPRHALTWDVAARPWAVVRQQRPRPRPLGLTTLWRSVLRSYNIATWRASPRSRDRQVDTPKFAASYLKPRPEEAVANANFCGTLACMTERSGPDAATHADLAPHDGANPGADLPVERSKFSRWLASFGLGEAPDPLLRPAKSPRAGRRLGH